MATDKKPFVQVVELEPDKLMIVSVVNHDQLKALYELIEPKSRSWRGQYQAMAKAFRGELVDQDPEDEPVERL